MTLRAAFFLAALATLAGLAVPPSYAFDNTWMDRAHASIESDLSGTIAWFDGFFGNELHEESEYRYSSVRLTNDFRWDEDENFDYRVRVRARIRLPSLKGKWRLLIDGENRGDPNAPAPEDPGNPGLEFRGTDGRASTEAAYELLETRNTLLFAGAGVRIRLDPTVFFRFRFLHVRELAYSVIGRLAVTPFWDARDGFGEANEVDFERPITADTLVRLSSFTSTKESETGWLLGTELSVLHKLSGSSAITAGGSVVGRTRPVDVERDYRVFARYRRSFLRRWLFYELEPDFVWRKHEDGSRETIAGGTVRLEVKFIGVLPSSDPW